MAEAVGNVAHEAARGAEEAALELIDVLFGWIIPIVTLIIGYLLSASIGLSGALGTLIDGILGAAGVSQTVMAYVAVAMSVLIWGTIAALMWHTAKRFDGKWASYILRPLATLFGGFALGEIPAGFQGKVNNGSLGKLATSEQLFAP